MIEQGTKTLLIRRGVLVLLLLGAGILQSCVLPFAGGFHVYYLLPLCVVIAMFEKEIPGAVFGIVGGCLWDLTTAIPDGATALFFAVIGALCGLLTRYFLRNNLASAYLLSGVATLLFSVGHWFFFVVLTQTPGSAAALVKFYLPQMLLTLLIVPFVYFIVRAIEKEFRLPGEARY